MTLEQAKHLYRFGGADARHYADEWHEVRLEMEAVVAAESDRAAGSIIKWWECWDRYYTATIFARRVRQEWTRMQKGKT